ncbi:restriction endonuclease subunit S [Salinisphaera sp. G21_0]|uniref:restriction endonuclease subunit S n=1 Tax=Salinisphaera sp. G21_0 TaxID=2821094 RepID=UPI001AD9D7AC|nr:restriction endonuclease subunit S [Salinisphaera sp. G21_0]MBO9484445.1 restriction endonuclease subunit S [Salinisphaera sp. G21_0]
MKLAPYPEYKNSGQPFLGKIPAHWQVFRNGRLFAQRNETGFGALPILEVSLRTGVRVRDMDNMKRKQVMSDREKYKRAAQGDIAYNMMRMWQGAVGVAPVDGLISPAYVVVRPFPDVDCRYYSYLFRTAAYMNEVDAYSRGIVKDRNRLYWQDFKRMPSPVPPVEEQRKITQYLDAISSQVQLFIRNKQQLITLLKEQKQNVINQAVTRGLDPHVKLKPSGVEWLVDIPEHWDVRRLKFLARIKNGKDYKEVEAESGYPVIGSGGQFAYASRFMYDGESVLFGRKGTVDKPLYISGKFWTVDTMFYTVVSKHISAKFLHYCALSFPFDFYSTQTALPSMTQQDLGDHPVAVPPMDEQKPIIQYIEEETQLINQTIIKAQREVELMLEHQTCLISAVVTGQLDIRNVEVPKISEEELLRLDENPIGSDEINQDEEYMDETI